MTVSDGQPVNAAISNAAWMSRSAATTSTVAAVALANTLPESLASITNIQRFVNELADADGYGGEGDASRKVYSSNVIITDGDDRKVAIGKLDERMDLTTGHTHNGIGTNGPKIDASDLDSFNDFWTNFQTTTVEPGVGLSDIVTTQFTGKSPGGGDVTAGVITTGSNNTIEIRTLLQNDNVEDASGRKVFGRLTEAAAVWTLTYFVNIVGVETAHSLTSQDIRIFFREVFTSATRPTTPSDVGSIDSLDVQSDIVDATQSLKGKTLLSSAAGADVANVGAVGTANATVANSDHAHRGVFTVKKSGDSDIFGTVTFSQGTNIALTQVANNIEVAATGGGGGGGGGSLEIILGTPTEPAPLELTDQGYSELEFDPNVDSGFVLHFTVSPGYTAGNDFIFNFVFSTPATTNDTIWDITTDLFRPGTSVRGTPTDTDTFSLSAASPSPANEFLRVAQTITTAGLLNATAIAANDFIIITFIRDADNGSDTNTDVSRVIKTSVAMEES